MTTPQLRCAVPACNHRFGKRSRSVVIVGTWVCCVDCAATAAGHAAVFPGCRQPQHTVFNHGAQLCTIGVARETLRAAAEITRKG
jgi:hypothetical protein